MQKILTVEHVAAVLAGLLITACDKTETPKAEPAASGTTAPAPVETPKVEAPAEPTAKTDEAVKDQPGAAVSAKEVAPAASAGGAKKAGSEKKCAPGGCAPGKCG